METVENQTQRKEAFNTIFGGDKRDITQEELRNIEILSEKMRIDDDDPMWWFIASQTVGKVDPVTREQIGKLEKAINAAGQTNLVKKAQEQIEKLQAIHNETQRSLGAINQSVARSVALHEQTTNHLVLWAVQKLSDHHLLYVLLVLAVLAAGGWWVAKEDGYSHAVHAAEMCKAQGHPIYLSHGEILCHPPKQNGSQP
jgi:hypothetical protein